MNRDLILVFNAGSSSLKFALFEKLFDGTHKTIIRGAISDIGKMSLLSWGDGVAKEHIQAKVINHEEAAEFVLDWLHHLRTSTSLLDGVRIVAHRIVHGGKYFNAPIIVTEKAMAQLEKIISLAPLHNPQAISVIRACRKKFTPEVLTVAVFDTTFFCNLPEYTNYALPEILAKKHDIRRYGFHGLAHRNMAQQYSLLHANNVTQQRVISFHLGHGCSVSATLNGKPVETSMGFTPLEGLVMATRAGDIDPGVLIYLLKNGHKLDELEQQLNHHSGLLGISKISADLHELLNWQNSNEQAKLAIDMFCHRARKYLGAYLAVLQGADVILFGGGIGENAAEIRQRICADMDWCGLRLDEKRNRSANAKETLISADDSRLRAYVILVNEENLIAEDASKVVSQYQSDVDLYPLPNS